MDRSYTTVVERVGIGAVLDQVDDDLPPPNGIQAPVGGVVQWFGSPSVARPHGSASATSNSGELSLIRGRRDVECRVTSIDVMANRDKEDLSGPPRLAPTLTGRMAKIRG